MEHAVTAGVLTGALVPEAGGLQRPARLAFNPALGGDLCTILLRMASLGGDALGLQGDDRVSTRGDHDGGHGLVNRRHLSMGMGALGTARTMHLLRRHIVGAIQGDQPLVREPPPVGHLPCTVQGVIPSGKPRNHSAGATGSSHVRIC